MNKFWVVTVETYKKHVKSASFIMMVLAPFLMIGFSLGAGYMGSKFSEVSEIAVVSEDPGLRETIVTQMTDSFDVTDNVLTTTDAEKELIKGNIDGYLAVGSKGNQVTGEYIGTQSLGALSGQEMQSYLSAAQLSLNSASLDLSQEEVGQLMTPASFSDKQVKVVDGSIETNASNGLALTMIGFFIVLAMYMIVLLYSSITAQEVASEKGTRIMEIILSSTTAAKHFYGKIAGIFLVILTQVLIYLFSGILGYTLAKDMDMVKDFLSVVSLSELIKGLLGFNLLYLLFGVLIYTILSAFTGSLVSKAEDAPKAVAPVTYLIMVASLPTMMIGMSNPQNILIKVFSYVPFFSSFAMPMRIANDDATTGQIMLSLGLLVLAIILLLRLSAKVYKSTVLIYSDKSMMKVFKEALFFSK